MAAKGDEIRVLTVDQWAWVADIYSPLLVLFTLIRLAGLLAASLVYIYLLMWIDRSLGIWQAMDWDYSTHTAFALVFVMYLARISLVALLVSGLSLCLYAGLMMYLHYHSLVDILSTTFAVAPVVYALKRLELEKKP